MYSISFDLNKLPKRYDQIYSYFFRRLDNKSDVENLTNELLIVLTQKTETVFDPNVYLNQLVEDILVKFIENSKSKEFYKLKNYNLDLSLRTKLIKYESRHFIKFKETLLSNSNIYCNPDEQSIIKSAVLANFSKTKLTLSSDLRIQKIRQQFVKIIKKFKNNFQIW